jgi:hypothetical protein
MTIVTGPITAVSSIDVKAEDARSDVRLNELRDRNRRLAARLEASLQT